MFEASDVTHRSWPGRPGCLFPPLAVALLDRHGPDATVVCASTCADRGEVERWRARFLVHSLRERCAYFLAFAAAAACPAAIAFTSRSSRRSASLREMTTQACAIGIK